MNKTISINTILHTIMVAWKTHEINFGNYTNHAHSAIFNNKDSVTFWFNHKHYRMTIEEIE